jgi:hypothetical protein
MRLLQRLILANGDDASKAEQVPAERIADGHRLINTGRGNWTCPRYGFTQVSADIRSIFCEACDLMGLRWTRSGERTVYISRKADVALLDRFIGPKR